MSKIEKLMGRVAAKLSGRPVVEVRVREPVWSCMSGAVYRTMDNRAILDVNPGANVLFSLLHEISHLKNNWSGMTPTDVWREAPGSLTIPPERRSANKALPREDAADRQAEEWKSFALSNSWKYYNGANQLEKCLLALLELDPEPVVNTKFFERWKSGYLK